MKASQVIEELQNLIQKHGDLEVTVYADHGQMESGAYSVDLAYADEDRESINPEDVENYDHDEITKVFSISGE